MTNWQGSQDELEAILNSITDGFFVLDNDWHFVFLNEQAKRWWRAYGDDQLDEQALLGAGAWDTFPGTVGGDLYSVCHYAVRKGVTTELETYVEPWEGWLGVRAYPFSGGLSVYLTDISKHKQAEAEVFQVLEEVTHDTIWFNRSLIGKLAQVAAERVGSAASWSKLPELTEREKQVLRRVAQGKDNSHIASDLGVVEQTVRNYITHLYTKLGVHSRAEAVVWASERGLVGS